MKISIPFSLALLLMVACAAPGEEGDACTADADCADGLECHVEEHDDHDDEEEDHEESGVCEAHDDDHDDHDDHDDEDDHDDHDDE